ncbi:hypothetical protein KI387_003151, partial [Taxus chinensis]
ACKAKYDALQERFDGEAWVEELRRLRVAQLRRELQRSDDSIGCLRSKVERLQAERARSGGGEGEAEREREGERNGDGDSKACSERSKDRSSAGSFTEAAEGSGRTAACASAKTGETAKQIDKADGIVKAGGARDRESNPSPARDKSEEERTGPCAPSVADPDRREEAKVAGSIPEEVQVVPSPPAPLVHHPASPLDSFYGSSETLADEENRRPLADFVESRKRANFRSKQRSRRPRTNAWSVLPNKPKGAMDSVAELSRHNKAEDAPPAINQDNDGCTENSGLQTADTNASERSFKRRRKQQGNKGLVVSSEEEGSGESMEEDKRVVESDVLSSVLPPRASGKGLSSSHEDYMTARSSGDSHMEGDDGGDDADQIETSPMSRRNRREPKVPGKLLPLLECLRSICNHKFGSLFKHKLESQNKQQYRNMIRRHMDLGMIRARLEEGSYSGSLEFFRDLLLIFNNALVYYPKPSQEYAAAWVLRQLATKEMENIFKTEALLKQEGPSTRKREPRRPELNSNAVKFNPASIGRKRNTRLSSGGRTATATGLPKSARLNYEQFPSAKNDDTNEMKEENNKPEEPKEAIERPSSTPQSPNPEIELRQKTEATFTRKLKDGSRTLVEGQGKKFRDNIVKISGSNIQPKKISGIEKDPDISHKSHDEPKKTLWQHCSRKQNSEEGTGGARIRPTTSKKRGWKAPQSMQEKQQQQQSQGKGPKDENFKHF